MNSLKSFPLALSEPLTESEMLDILGGFYDSVVKTDLEAGQSHLKIFSLFRLFPIEFESLIYEFVLVFIY